ncbi:ankyrin repeat domain-containing protein 50 [Trichonephila clavipes]|nr:ankyrin repeat domain-containing protein 50 [Trichonephila clavipes]
MGFGTEIDGGLDSSKYDILESLHRERRSKQPLRILADHIIRRKPPEFIKEFIEEEDLFGCLDEPIKKGLRLLHYAVYQDEMGIVLLLLDYDANPNVMDEIGYTPVHICAEKGYNHLIQILMSYGARIRFTELNPEDQSYGQPPRATLADEPLRLAIRNCEHETARFLLEHGANPCALYYLGYEINLVNPVDFESIELLLLYGADVDSRDFQGLTPLMKACRHSQAIEAVHLLIRNSNLGHITGQANAVRGINADQIREIKLRLSYLQGKSTTMSVIAHQTEKEWISANEKSRQRMSQTQAEGAAKQHAARLEEPHLRAHHLCFTTSERC